MGEAEMKMQWGKKKKMQWGEAKKKKMGDSGDRLLGNQKAKYFFFNNFSKFILELIKDRIETVANRLNDEAGRSLQNLKGLVISGTIRRHREKHDH